MHHIFETQWRKIARLPIIDPWLEKLLFIGIGALLTYLLQQIRVAAAESIALMNEHIKDIEKFNDAVQNYWLKKPASRDEELALAARVRAAHAATTLLYEKMAETCEDRSEDYKRLSQELFHSATGGKFESSNRDIDPVRAIESHDKSVQLVHLLRECRQGVLSLRRITNRL